MNFSSVCVGAIGMVMLTPSIIAVGGAVTPICRFRGLDEARAAPAPAAVGCRRPGAGEEAISPTDLYSRHGHLAVRLDYRASTDREGRTLFCFVTPDGVESPTLHVRPGDTLDILLTNRTPRPPPGATGVMAMGVGSNVCGAAIADASSVNLHFHGLGVPATCHADDVIHTSVNAGQSFAYHLTIPRDQAPGVYWYHPHVHGLAETAVLGGASGAIVVDGIEAVAPGIARLPPRMLVIRDQTVAGSPPPHGTVPSWDISLNYVPIAYPRFAPAVIRLRPGRREFWRLLNASANTVVDLHLKYDGVDQPLQIVALDGVPVRSPDGAPGREAVMVTHVLIPAGGRAEFAVTGPSATVAHASLETDAIDTGPAGDNEPSRTLARLDTTRSAAEPDAAGPAPRPASDRSSSSSGGLVEPAVAPITGRRRLYFSEVGSDDAGAADPTRFFVTIAGEKPRAFSPNASPEIVTRQGAVEEWTIENHAREIHEFHIHQIHFTLVGRDGKRLPASQQQQLDTVQIPYWRGGPYPSVTVRMDFRGEVTGDLLYHCHILQHEDAGMMAIVRVLPRSFR
jgi:FtsP/CotA-like multicopper oxidase with cupredoxin domain